MNGAQKGLTIRFGNISTFQKSKVIRIGGDPDWSDLRLPNDSKVSKQHCVLMVRSEGVNLMDYGQGGKGSTNGTTLHGRKLSPNRWKVVGNADHFYVTNIKIRLVR